MRSVLQVGNCGDICEQDWQAEQWGWEQEAEHDRAARLAAFEAGARFVGLVRR